MTRDPRDALRERAEALEAEIARVRERGRAAEADRARLEERLERLRAQIAATPRRAPGAMGMAVALLAVGLSGVAALFWVERSPPPTSDPAPVGERPRGPRRCVTDAECPGGSCAAGRCEQEDPFTPGGIDLRKNEPPVPRRP